MTLGAQRTVSRSPNRPVSRRGCDEAAFKTYAHDLTSHLDTWILIDMPACQKYVSKESPRTPYLDEDVQTRPYGMHTIPESPSRCEGLVSIAPKTRYAHAETPSRQVQNEDRPQSAPPRLRSSDDQGRFCVARGTVWGVCSDHRGSQRACADDALPSGVGPVAANSKRVDCASPGGP